MYLAIVGFLMLAIIMIMLFKSKTIPLVLFIIVPVVAAFVAGFSIPEVVGFIEKGVGKVSKMSILFIFSVTFFGILSDAGMFDYLVSKLVKKAGKNLIIIAIVTAIVAIFSHLDGATVTTVLVTVPALLPLYKKLNIRPHLLLLIIGCGMGVMNLLPWGGPVAREAAVLGMDPNELWHILIPIQILGIIATISLAVVMMLREIKYHGAGQISSEHVSMDEEEKETKDEIEKLKRPKLIAFNFILTGAVLVILLMDIFPTYFVFMFGCSVALFVNYPDVKDQKARIKAHAPAALDVAAVMLAAGVLVGDSYFYGLLPLCIKVGENYNITPLTMGVAMIIGKNLSLLVSPLVPATYLGIGLTNLDLKEHIKYSIVPLWIVGAIMLIFAILIGMVKL